MAIETFFAMLVAEAVEDTQRTLAWIYGNTDKITQLAFSLDTHRVFQIFHPAWWIDDDGKHPGPFTPISTKDVKEGRWKPVMHPGECLEYVKKLEASGKYTLTIWPYHTLLGGVSHALVPALMGWGVALVLLKLTPMFPPPPAAPERATR